MSKIFAHFESHFVANEKFKEYETLSTKLELCEQEKERLAKENELLQSDKNAADEGFKTLIELIGIKVKIFN